MELNTARSVLGATMAEVPALALISLTLTGGAALAWEMCPTKVRAAQAMASVARFKILKVFMAFFLSFSGRHSQSADRV